MGPTDVFGLIVHINVPLITCVPEILILILLEISRFVAAKELSAASFQQYLYHRGCVGQRYPVNTRGIKAARGRRGIIIPVGYNLLLIQYRFFRLS
jgi:hypothetical protein